MKIPVDCSKFEYLLEQIGYKKPRIGRQVVEEDHYFAHPCRDFSITDEVLRVRYSDNDVILTYKGPRIEVGDAFKTREEIEVKLKEGDIKSLLEKLGFKEIAVIRKRRTYIEVEDFVVTFDDVEDLGCFVEIESRGQPDPTFLADLMFERREYTPIKETYLELYLKKKKAEEIFKDV